MADIDTVLGRDFGSPFRTLFLFVMRIRLYLYNDGMLEKDNSKELIFAADVFGRRLLGRPTTSSLCSLRSQNRPKTSQT
jgi:hypothetical protein